MQSTETSRPTRVIALTPQGRQLDQALVEELADEPGIAVLSSRFEGFDARIVDHLCTDAVSIGPYVLSGGELPAMVLVDAIARRLPGRTCGRVGGERELQRGARRWASSTRTTRVPRSSEGWEVPDVLLSGNHARHRQLAGRAEPTAKCRMSGVEDPPDDARRARPIPGRQPPVSPPEAASSRFAPRAAAAPLSEPLAPGLELRPRGLRRSPEPPSSGRRPADDPAAGYGWPMPTDALPESGDEPYRACPARRTGRHRGARSDTRGIPSIDSLAVCRTGSASRSTGSSPSSVRSRSSCS